MWHPQHTSLDVASFGFYGLSDTMLDNMRFIFKTKLPNSFEMETHLSNMILKFKPEPTFDLRKKKWHMIQALHGKPKGSIILKEHVEISH